MQQRDESVMTGMAMDERDRPSPTTGHGKGLKEYGAVNRSQSGNCIGRFGGLKCGV